MNDLFENALQNLSDSDMGMTIQNRVNQNDKSIGLSFRLKRPFSGRRYGASLRQSPIVSLI